MSPPTLLLVAKAPVPGEAKTRLAAAVGSIQAARLAAAALLDTMDTVAGIGWPVVVASTGKLEQAVCSQHIEAAYRRHRVVPQRGKDFAHRLAAAHSDADAGSGVVQIGMDTPQLRAWHLRRAANGLQTHDAALGIADDGGWWVLAVRQASLASCLRTVPTSTPDTGRLTTSALMAAGATVAQLPAIRDVDTWEDACAVASGIPASRFAAEVARCKNLIG